MKNNKASAARTETRKASAKKAQHQVLWRELGEVAVDTGRMVVCDPHYLRGVDPERFCNQLLKGGDHVEHLLDGGGILNGAKIENTWGKKYLGLTLPHFGGDGVFPVYGTFNSDGTLAALFIAFNENRYGRFQSGRISKEESEALMHGKSEENKAQIQTPVRPVNTGVDSLEVVSQ